MLRTEPLRAVVIGGGLAGMSAAAALSGEGYRVTLVEKRPLLGGRAGSHIEAGTGDRVDNCQHVLMPCCTNLADFYRRIGVSDKIRFHPEIPFVDRRGQVSLLRSHRLPAPLHLAPSFFRLKFLHPGEKLRIARGMLSMVRAGEADGSDTTPAREWLLAHHQTPASIESFWQMVLVSALNEDLERTSLRYAAKVLVDAFLSHPQGWWLGVPCEPLSSLYGDPLVRLLEQSRGSVRLQSEASSVLVEDSVARSVALVSGERLEADVLVVALPWRSAAALLSGHFRNAGEDAAFERLAPSPITGIHLWFDRAVTDLGFAALPGRGIHWLFNKTLNFGGGRGENSYLQLVTSASRQWLELGKSQILTVALRELGEVLPLTRTARITKSYVLKEPAATFSPAPGSDAFRPLPSTPIRNLFLAGDWIETGWPSTMEGAVRGGYLAAEAVLRHASRPARILRPDLPATGLMRWLRR